MLVSLFGDDINTLLPLSCDYINWYVNLIHKNCKIVLFRRKISTHTISVGYFWPHCAKSLVGYHLYIFIEIKCGGLSITDEYMVYKYPKKYRFMSVIHLNKNIPTNTGTHDSSNLRKMTILVIK